MILHPDSVGTIFIIEQVITNANGGCEHSKQTYDIQKNNPWTWLVRNWNNR